VAVIKLEDTLKVGDTIRIVGGQTDFTQTVESMEIEHQKVKEAKAGIVALIVGVAVGWVVGSRRKA
jgi:uncharacterized transporter YbjL